MTTDTFKVTLGDKEYKMKLPSSYSVRYDLLTAASKARRFHGALLGACWFDRGRPGVEKEVLTLEGYDYDAMKFGGDVYDILRERGHSDDDIVTAGNVISGKLLASLDLGGVQKTEDFSGDADTSTSSS